MILLAVAKKILTDFILVKFNNYFKKFGNK